MHKTISVIIPTLNAEENVANLIELLLLQSLKPNEIIIVDSESDDKTVEIARAYHDVKVIQIRRKDFNHGRTRDMALRNSMGDIIIFMTQDAVPANNDLLKNLTKPFADNNIAVSTARQLPSKGARPAEKLIREFNYPAESCIRTKNDIQRYGIKTFFTSDVCSAYSRSIYENIGGFEKDITISEDMMFAVKAIFSGYYIYYSADAQVIHSHNFTLKEQYKRSYLQGVEIERHKQFLCAESLNDEGMRMVKYVLPRLVKKGKIISSVRFGFDCMARYLGNRGGRNVNDLHNHP